MGCELAGGDKCGRGEEGWLSGIKKQRRVTSSLLTIIWDNRLAQGLCLTIGQSENKEWVWSVDRLVSACQIAVVWDQPTTERAECLSLLQMGNCSQRTPDKRLMRKSSSLIIDKIRGCVK